MNVVWILVFLFLELWGLAFLAQQVGAPYVLWGVVLKGFLSLMALRWVLGAVVPRALASRPQRVPAVFAVALGLGFLAVPGLITDLLGITLLLPGVRNLWRPLLARIVARGARFRFPGGMAFGVPPRRTDAPREVEGTPHRGREQAGAKVAEEATGPKVVDAEFRILDERDP